MRIHASGTGRTLTDALVKVNAELDTVALHYHELEFKNEGGQPKIDPAAGRKANPHADLLKGLVSQAGTLVAPVPGYLFRVLVSASDDKTDAHCKVEIDLIRE